MTTTTSATADVACMIADIERRRLETIKHGGSALACSTALHRLRELLYHESEALRMRGPRSVHLANVEALGNEIARVKSLGPAG